MQEAIAEGLDAGNIERDARRRLEGAGYAVLKNISCRFRSGTMVLRGDVPSYYHKQIAQEAIRTLRNVSSIENHITVTS
jgi:osmotically-inducible protein OsmY